MNHSIAWIVELFLKWFHSPEISVGPLATQLQIPQLRTQTY